MSAMFVYGAQWYGGFLRQMCVGVSLFLWLCVRKIRALGEPEDDGLLNLGLVSLGVSVDAVFLNYYWSVMPAPAAMMPPHLHPLPRTCTIFLQTLQTHLCFGASQMRRVVKQAHISSDCQHSCSLQREMAGFITSLERYRLTTVSASALFNLIPHQ